MKIANPTFDSGNRGLNEHVISQVVVESMIARRSGGYAGSGSVLPGPFEVVVFRTVVVPTQTVFK